MRQHMAVWSALGAFVVVSSWACARAADDRGERLAFTLRSRVEAPGHGGACRVVEKAESWDPKRTAVIICDMWDLHHCLNATRRGAELAPRMDRVVKALRDRGVTVIHAPSECMDAYKDHPARLRARAIPKAKNLPDQIAAWCRQIPAEEASAYPVDQRGGGEDDDPDEHDQWQARLAALGRNPKAPWKAETPSLTIDPDVDFITDDGREVWSVLESRGLNQVILMGVHLNMCVLGRPFGLRQLAKNGKHVVLMRDMTDTMYDPQKAPYVSHFTGTDRMVEHVERYVCPTLTSDQVIGGKPFRFRGDTRPHVVFVVAEDEYRTETTLPPFAATHLGKDYRVSFVFDDPADPNSLPGLNVLDDADLAVISVRRRLLPKEQLAVLRRYVRSGKPVVGVRTASHAFAARPGISIPTGHDAWPEFDAEVLGGHYTGHHPEGPTVAVSPAQTGPRPHPILYGLTGQAHALPLQGHGSLYKVRPLASSAVIVLTGSIPGERAEPVLWTNLTSTGGRVVYTSLGQADDFAQAPFKRLLRNAIDWAAGREVFRSVETASTEAIPFPK